MKNVYFVLVFIAISFVNSTFAQGDVFLSGYSVNSLVRVDDNVILAGTDKGLWRYTNGQWTVVPNLSTYIINDIAVGANKNVWIATNGRKVSGANTTYSQNGGVFLLETPLSNDTISWGSIDGGFGGLTSRNVTGIEVDLAQNVWTSHSYHDKSASNATRIDGGLSYRKPNFIYAPISNRTPFEQKNDGIPTPTTCFPRLVETIGKGADITVWTSVRKFFTGTPCTVDTTNVLYQFNESGTLITRIDIQSFPVGSNLRLLLNNKNAFVRAISTDKSKNTWFGFSNLTPADTVRGILIRKFDGTWAKIPSSVFPTDASVMRNAIFENANGVTYVGTDKGLVALTFANGNFNTPTLLKIYDKSNTSLSSNKILSINYNETDNSIYVGTDLGGAKVQVPSPEWGKVIDTYFSIQDIAFKDNPVPNVTVKLLKKSDGTELASTITDLAGVFKFPAFDDSKDDVDKYKILVNYIPYTIQLLLNNTLDATGCNFGDCNIRLPITAKSKIIKYNDTLQNLKMSFYSGPTPIWPWSDAASDARKSVVDGFDIIPLLDTMSQWNRAASIDQLNKNLNKANRVLIGQYFMAESLRNIDTLNSRSFFYASTVFLTLMDILNVGAIKNIIEDKITKAKDVLDKIPEGTLFHNYLKNTILPNEGLPSALDKLDKALSPISEIKKAAMAGLKKALVSDCEGLKNESSLTCGCAKFVQEKLIDGAEWTIGKAYDKWFKSYVDTTLTMRSLVARADAWNLPQSLNFNKFIEEWAHKELSQYLVSEIIVKNENQPDFDDLISKNYSKDYKRDIPVFAKSTIGSLDSMQTDIDLTKTTLKTYEAVYVTAPNAIKDVISFPFKVAAYFGIKDLTDACKFLDKVFLSKLDAVKLVWQAPGMFAAVRVATTQMDDISDRMSRNLVTGSKQQIRPIGLNNVSIADISLFEIDSLRKYVTIYNTAIDTVRKNLIDKDSNSCYRNYLNLNQKEIDLNIAFLKTIQAVESVVPYAGFNRPNLDSTYGYISNMYQRNYFSKEYLQLYLTGLMFTKTTDISTVGLIAKLDSVKNEQLWILNNLKNTATALMDVSAPPFVNVLDTDIPLEVKRGSTSFTVKVRNFGGSEAKNVAIKINFNRQIALVKDSFYFESMASRSEKTITLNVNVPNNINDTTYTYNISMTGANFIRQVHSNAFIIKKPTVSTRVKDVTSFNTSFITVSPNPTTAKITLKQTTAPNQGPLSINVSNSVGQVVWQQKVGNLDGYTIDLGDQPNGIYFVKVSLQDGRFQTEKVVIQH